VKHQEFYIKYKTNCPPLINPIFSKGNWWRVVLTALGAVLIEPLISFKQHRSVPLSLTYYLQLIEYFFFIAVPFVAFLFWINWRESVRRTRGYGWVGKFEVVNKRLSLASCYLLLTPGHGNKLRVNRVLFERTRIGDIIQIRRDAFGAIEEISKINNSASRLAKAAARQSPSEPHRA